MVNVLSQNGQITYDVYEFAIDTPEDLKKLPTKSAPGSIAIIISTGAVYMKNSAGKWVEI